MPQPDTIIRVWRTDSTPERVITKLILASQLASLGPEWTDDRTTLKLESRRES